ncbi:Ig-like domain-containing protein [Cellulomonas sp. ACRRI]|uniref:Ig-like domain-containing protein n=1 Tax=Cellulomonas sp. ACRRI TaxID=2918188 RepID=UPI001EF3B191|nr:Ig-like domain-containing protein [Cellulomonas sp. ACRRI]MCG7286889.1 Ig-like domain-containing protein [Cellulomonas sp. ACRRI]
MLIPAGAASADEGVTDPNAVVETQPVADPQAADPQQQPDPQPQPDTPDQGSTTPVESTPVESTPVESTPVESTPVTSGSGSGEDTSPTPDTPAQGDTSDTDVPADTTPVADQPSTGTTTPEQDVPDTDQDSGDTGPSFSAGGFRVSGYSVDPQGNRVAVAGQTLTLERTEPTPEDTEYSWDWRTNSGWRGASAQFTPTSDDVGKQLVLTVIAYTDEGIVRVLTENFGLVLAEAPASGPVTTQPTSPVESDPQADDRVEAPDEWTDFVFSGTTTDEWGDPIATIGTPITVHPTTNWMAGTTFTYEWRLDDFDGPVVGEGTTYVPTDLNRSIYLVADPTPVDNSALGAGTIVASNTIAPTVPGDSDSDDDPGLKPMPEGWFQIEAANGYELAYGKEYTATPTGFAPGAEYTVRWTVDGVQVGSGRTFTPAAGQIGQFVDLEFEVRAEGYETYTSVRSAGWVQAQPTVTVSAPTITAGAAATVTVSVTGPAKAPQVTGPVDLSVHGNGYSRPLTGQSLQNGVATYSVPNLPAGSYELTASYTGDQMWARSFSVLGASFGGYTSAQGEGTLTVLPAAATVTAPATLTVPVAMRSTFDAKVSVPGSVLPASWTLREGTTVLSHGATHDGRFAVTVPVLTAGTHTLVLEVPATEFSAAAAATITVTVVGEPVRTGTTPSAQLDTPKAATAPGQQMELVAEGFQPGETVAFYLHSDPVFLGTSVADANGVARLMATVPADVPTGAHTVYATGGTTGRWATLAVQLAVPVPTEVTPVSAPVAAVPAALTPAATGAGELAVTGSEGGALGVAAALLLGLGGALVLATRRLRATR